MKGQMKIKLFALATLLMCSLLLQLPTNAQTSRGTVSGVVSDPVGAVIPGAGVVLTSAETGLTRTTSSNSEGFYRFDAVDLGTYSIDISAAGFGTLTKTGVIVNANQTSSV